MFLVCVQTLYNGFAMSCNFLSLAAFYFTTCQLYQILKSYIYKDPAWPLNFGDYALNASIFTLCLVDGCNQHLFALILLYRADGTEQTLAVITEGIGVYDGDDV